MQLCACGVDSVYGGDICDCCVTLPGIPLYLNFQSCSYSTLHITHTELIMIILMTGNQLYSRVVCTIVCTSM